MKTTPSVWKAIDTNDYFLVPENSVLKKGDYIIQDLNGNERSVDVSDIRPFAASEESILDFLKTDYTEKVKSVRESLFTLNAFAAQTGKFDEASLKDLAKTEFEKQSREEQGPFAFSKDIIEDLMAGISDTNASPEEQMQHFKTTMDKVPDVMKYFDEHNLALAAKDPEAWAKTIHDKLFGEQEAKKKAADTERLKKEVQESIARGLRKAGMKPLDPSTGEELD